MHGSKTALIQPILVPGTRRNLLLDSLAPGDARLLKPHLKRVAFAPGDIVASPDASLDRAFFPETALISFREASASPQRPEIGMVGHEGMVGWPLLLGASKSSLMCVAHTSGGTALAIRARPLAEACQLSPALHTALLRYVHNFMLQMASTIVSVGDTVERRVARWVLMVHDRAEGDMLALTHDQIGTALSVRRASVTDCLHLLEGDGILKCVRGRIQVRDRAALVAVAGGAYGVPESHFATEIRGRH